MSASHTNIFQGYEPDAERPFVAFAGDQSDIVPFACCVTIQCGTNKVTFYLKTPLAIMRLAEDLYGSAAQVMKDQGLTVKDYEEKEAACDSASNKPDAEENPPDNAQQAASEDDN